MQHSFLFHSSHSFPGGKNLEQGENQQHTQPRLMAPESILGQIGGRQGLNRHCTILVARVFSDFMFVCCFIHVVIDSNLISKIYSSRGIHVQLINSQLLVPRIKVFLKGV